MTSGDRPRIVVLEPTVPPPEDLDPRWVWSDEYVVARHVRGRTVHGPDVPTVVTTTEGGVTRREVRMLPAWTKVIPPEDPPRCPVFGDVVPYRSVTVVVPAGLERDAVYSLEFVQGGGCISRRRELPDGRVALRSDYMAW